MQSKGVKYEFSAVVSRYTPEDKWHLVFFPYEMAKEIRQNFRHLDEGWGRMKAIAKIGNTEWKTSIWFDTKHQTYMLPIKAEIRKKEGITFDQEIKTTIWI
jgi:hypothetical protein